MDKLKLAWAAGIIDGEGCILIYQAHTHTGEAWVLRLIVVNTSLIMLKRLKRIFGIGNISLQRRHSRKHQACWRWEVSTRKAEYVLRLVLPYLVNKKREARLGLYSRRLIRTLGINTPNPNFHRFPQIKKQLSALKRKP